MHTLQAYDLFGWSADFLEWLALYLAAVDEKVGMLSHQKLTSTSHTLALLWNEKL